MIAHHEAAQAGISAWLAVGGLSGATLAVRMWWAKRRRSGDDDI